MKCPSPFHLLPFLLLIGLAASMVFGLFSPKPEQQYRLIGQPMPHFTLPGFDKDTPLTSAMWKGKPAIINIFASWCLPCAAEHPRLLALKESGKIDIYGVAWKNKPENLVPWLARLGNPYTAIGYDRDGALTVLLAITGIPETFVLDSEGIIRFHYNEPLTEDIIERDILPLAEGK